jgi:hypothetical protein
MSMNRARLNPGVDPNQAADSVARAQRALGEIHRGSGCKFYLRNESAAWLWARELAQAATAAMDAGRYAAACIPAFRVINSAVAA